MYFMSVCKLQSVYQHIKKSKKMNYKKDQKDEKDEKEKEKEVIVLMKKDKHSSNSIMKINKLKPQYLMNGITNTETSMIVIENGNMNWLNYQQNI